jgi:hypothetical protein
MAAISTLPLVSVKAPLERVSVRPFWIMELGPDCARLEIEVKKWDWVDIPLSREEAQRLVSFLREHYSKSNEVFPRIEELLGSREEDLVSLDPEGVLALMIILQELSKMDLNPTLGDLCCRMIMKVCCLFSEHVDESCKSDMVRILSGLFVVAPGFWQCGYIGGECFFSPENLAILWLDLPPEVMSTKSEGFDEKVFSLMLNVAGETNLRIFSALMEKIKPVLQEISWLPTSSLLESEVFMDWIDKYYGLCTRQSVYDRDGELLSQLDGALNRILVDSYIYPCEITSDGVDVHLMRMTARALSLLIHPMVDDGVLNEYLSIAAHSLLGIDRSKRLLNQDQPILQTEIERVECLLFRALRDSCRLSTVVSSTFAAAVLKSPDFQELFKRRLLESPLPEKKKIFELLCTLGDSLDSKKPSEFEESPQYQFFASFKSQLENWLDESFSGPENETPIKPRVELLAYDLMGKLEEIAD